MNRLIKRAILAWQSWQTKRRLYREIPLLRSYDEAERIARDKHWPVRGIQKAKAAVMLQALRGEVRG